MQSHEIDYKIMGHDVQLVEVELDPGETVIAEAGAMLYMEDGISFDTKMGDGSNPRAGFFDKVLAAGSRLITGESLFITHFTNQGWGKRHVAFSAPYPGTIIPINLLNHRGSLIVQKDAFLCAALGTKISMRFNRKLGAGFFGGEGFIMQKLEGDGLAFVHSGGTLVERELKHGEILKVDTGCVVGYTRDVQFDIEFVGGLKNSIFGGEGLFFAVMRGPGTVFLQSLPFSRLADRIIASAPRAGGRGREEGSILGGIGNLFDGDNRF